MLAPGAIFHRPTFKFIPSHCPKLKSRKPISFPTSSTSSKLRFAGGVVSKNAFLKEHGVLGRNTMLKTWAFGSGDGEEGVGVLEQEAFVDGSSDFRPVLVAHGLQSTLNRLSKWLVAALFGAVILWRHDAEALWVAMGSVINAGLSVILKRVLNQERPASALKSDPGMPSSHAQSLFFTVFFAILSMIEWLGINELTLTLSGLALAFGSYLSWLRVSQQFHTISQVAVGAALGSAFSVLWCWSWDAIVLKAFISSLWVQILVILGAVGFCIGFLLYVIRYWFMDER